MAHGHINDKLNEILEQLQGLRNTLVTATVEILEAIDNVHRQIDEDVALDAIALADRALFTVGRSRLGLNK